jgi:myo-inositol-1(or 4)-monophosphatase
MMADHALLARAVRDAGILAKRYFENGFKSWDKKPNDPVTEADIAVNELLKEQLTSQRSGYGWLSEETADTPERLGCDRVWIVDPIDGTRAFVAGKPEFTVSVALVEAGKPVLAAIYNPMTEEFFEAAEGAGARLNGAIISCEPTKQLAGATLLASRRTFEHRDWLKSAEGASFHHINSIAYRMALVAAGRYSATITLSQKSDWDIAAADLILREAGGIATTSGGASFTYNREHTRHKDVIAAGAVLHEKILELVRRKRP